MKKINISLPKFYAQIGCKYFMQRRRKRPGITKILRSEIIRTLQSSLSSFGRDDLFFRSHGIRGEINKKIDIAKTETEIGLLKKIVGSPFSMSKDRRRVVSIIGPKTRAKTKGAPSYSNFLKRYPMIPKITIIQNVDVAIA